MKSKLYYTAPSQEIFEEVRTVCISFRKEHQFNEDKVQLLVRLKNHKDNFMYMVAKLDRNNQTRLHNTISALASLAIGTRMLAGGMDLIHVPFEVEEVYSE